jgi:Flp pilus assembly pilin Flp
MNVLVGLLAVLGALVLIGLLAWIVAYFLTDGFSGQWDEL